MNKGDKKICIRERMWRLEHNKFTLMYTDNEEFPDSFLFGIKEPNNLTFNDLKDLTRLTRELTQLVEKPKKENE